MVGIDAASTIAMTIVTTAEDSSRSPTSHKSMTFVANGVETQNGPATATLHANGASNSSSLVFVNGGRSKSFKGDGVSTKPNSDQSATGTVVNGAGVSSNGSNGATKEIKRQKSGRHAGVGEKTILQNDELNQYILKTNVYPREHEQLKELRLMTAKHRWNLMLSPADEGQFLQVLLKLMNAKNTIEVGTYTGYSLLATALALPADGKIVAMDLNRDCLDLGWPYIEKAGVASKIDFMGGPALDSLKALLTDETKHNSFDFAFVDADKNNYMHYHECLLKLVRVGGVIAYDNTLWNGSVTATEEELATMPKYIRHYQPFITKLNEFLGQDPRVEPALLSIGDGVTLCRRVI